MSAVWCSPRAVDPGRSSAGFRCAARMRARSASSAAGSGVVVVILDALSGGSGAGPRTLPPAAGLWGGRAGSGAVGLVGCGCQLELGPAVVRHEVEVGRVALDVAADER